MTRKKRGHLTISAATLLGLLSVGACQQSDDVVGAFTPRRLDSTPPGCDEQAALRKLGLVRDWLSVVEECSIPLDWTPLLIPGHSPAKEGPDGGVPNSNDPTNDRNETSPDDALWVELLKDRIRVTPPGMLPMCNEKPEWHWGFVAPKVVRYVFCPSLCEIAVATIEERLATGCALLRQ